MGWWLRARAVLHCHGVLALRDRPLTTFGTMGCRPQARSVLHCHGVLALRDRPLSGALMAAQEGGRMKGLRLVSSQFRSNVWHNGLPAAGPIRTSLPWCFGSARPSFDNVWHNGLPAAGPIRTSLPWCFGSARPSFDIDFCWQCRKAGEWKVWD